MELITKYDPKPIPSRQFDWSCVDQNYEEGCVIGYGETEEQAIQDYMEQAQ